MTIKKCYPKKSIMLKLTYANKPYLQQHISNNWFKKSSIVNLISPYNVWVQEILFKDRLESIYFALYKRVRLPCLEFDCGKGNTL